MFKLSYASAEALLETLNSVVSSEAIVKISAAGLTASEKAIIRVDVVSKGNAEQVTEKLEGIATADVADKTSFEAKAKAVATKLTAVLGTITDEEAAEAEIEFRTGKAKLTIVGGLGKFETELLSSDTELLPTPNMSELLCQATCDGKALRRALAYGSRGSADAGADGRPITKAITLQINIKSGMLQVRATNGELLTAAACKVAPMTKASIEKRCEDAKMPVDDPRAAKMFAAEAQMVANRAEAGDEENVIIALSNERVRALSQFLKTAGEATKLFVGKTLFNIQCGERFYGCSMCAGTESIFPQALITSVAGSLKESGRIKVASENYARAVGNLLTATEGDRSKLRIKMTLDGEKTLLCTSSDNGELKVPVESAEGTADFTGVTLKALSISSILKGLDEKIVIAVSSGKSPVGFYNAETGGADGTLAIVLPINPSVAEKADKGADKADTDKKAKKKVKAEKPDLEEKPETSEPAEEAEA